MQIRRHTPPRALADVPLRSVTTRLPVDLHERLRRLAYERGQPIQAVMTAAISNSLGRLENETRSGGFSAA
jgi:hypothetical protein